MKSLPKKVAIIGINGLPPKYGGFETLADNLTRYLSCDFRFTIFCSRTSRKDRLLTYNRSRLIYLPFRANGYQSIFFDSVAIIYSYFIADVLLIMGPTAGYALILNKIFRKRIIVNYGGLNEWERSKYGFFGRLWLKLNYYISTKMASVNISDNLLLKKSLEDKFNCMSMKIRYGGDHVRKIPFTAEHLKKYSFLPEPYVINVSRAQSDNNLHLVLESFKDGSRFKLVVVSNWNVNKYGRELKKKYSGLGNIVLLNAVYDQEELNVLRSNAALYIHSHSMCGTAPSLVEAMCLGMAVLCFDVPVNRETTHDEAVYFTSAIDLQDKLNSLSDCDIEEIRKKMTAISSGEFKWEKIAGEYSKIM